MHALTSPPLQPAPTVRRMAYFGPVQARAQRLAALLPAQVELSWEAGKVENAATAGWAALFVDFDPEQPQAGAALAARLAQACPHLPLVGVGPGDARRADVMLAAIRAGARDYLAYDASAEELGLVLSRLARPAAAPPQPAAVPEPAALVVLLLGARPGIGVSTLAANLAVMCQQDEPQTADGSRESRFLLLDLGHPAGDPALYLDGTGSDFHLADALNHVGRLDATMARSAIARHSSGVAVLGQPPGSAGLGAVELGPLLDRLRRLYSVILCDLGGTPVQQLPPALFARADEIWLVTDQAICTLMSTELMLQQIRQLNLSEHRIRLVFNRCDDQEGMAPGLIASRFSIPLAATLPHRPGPLRTCANRGVLLCQQFPRDPYLRALRALKDRLSYTRPRPVRPVAGWRALATRIGIDRWIRA